MGGLGKASNDTKAMAVTVTAATVAGVALHDIVVQSETAVNRVDVTAVHAWFTTLYKRERKRATLVLGATANSILCRQPRLASLPALCANGTANEKRRVYVPPFSLASLSRVFLTATPGRFALGAVVDRRLAIVWNTVYLTRESTKPCSKRATPEEIGFSLSSSCWGFPFSRLLPSSCTFKQQESSPIGTTHRPWTDYLFADQVRSRESGIWNLFVAKIISAASPV
jgi:hypothetical protein